ncbi:MAG: MFS transporter, partial [Alphaproteobacteria bacterium]|nr:MFS transporter [Alphaproteobacteria bacterium]
MKLGSARLAVLFSNLGHFYVHLFTAFYAVIVLQLEREWDSSYEDLLRLWTLGALLTGVMALPAGRLGDVWNARILMSIYFIGMGGASIVCGLVDGPTALMLGLAGIGFFGAIYHPVGIPWLIRNARRHTGRNLAVNGIFGTFGTAGAGLIAGTLITMFSWRAAFFVPGAVCLITGLIMLYCVLTG